MRLSRRCAQVADICGFGKSEHCCPWLHHSYAAGLASRSMCCPWPHHVHIASSYKSEQLLPLALAYAPCGRNVASMLRLSCGRISWALVHICMSSCTYWTQWRLCCPGAWGGAPPRSHRGSCRGGCLAPTGGSAVPLAWRLVFIAVHA